MASGSNPIPAGLELVYDLEKGNVSNALDAFVLSLHWSIIRTGLRQRSGAGGGGGTSSTGSVNEFTERLPIDWPERIAGASTSPTRTLTLTYFDPRNQQIKYELKVIELTANDMVAVTFFRSPNNNAGGGGGNNAKSSSSSPATPAGASSANRPASTMSSGVEKNSAAATFQIGNFIRNAAFEEGTRRDRAGEVYERADLLETQLYALIMEPLGLRVMGQAPVPGPYDDKASNNKTRKTESREESTRERRQIDPLLDDRFTRPDLGRHPSPLGPGMPLGPL
jgi:hypothetical protein